MKLFLFVSVILLLIVSFENVNAESGYDNLMRLVERQNGTDYYTTSSDDDDDLKKCGGFGTSTLIVLFACGIVAIILGCVFASSVIVAVALWGGGLIMLLIWGGVLFKNDICE